MLKFHDTKQGIPMNIGLNMLVFEYYIIPILPQEPDCQRENESPRGLVAHSANIILAIFFKPVDQASLIEVAGIIDSQPTPSMSRCLTILSLCRIDSGSLWHKGQISESLMHLLTRHSPTLILLCKHCQMKVLIRGKVSSFQTQHPVKAPPTVAHPVAIE